MDASVASPVPDRRSDRCGHDATLERTVDAARQEFPGLTDEEIKALWTRLRTILIQWAQRSGEPLPRHRSFFPSPDRNLHVSATTHALTDEIDFVVLFFLADAYGPLEDFLQELAPQPLSSLRKAFALMILRHAQDRNCPEIKRLMHSFERVVQ